MTPLLSPHALHIPDGFLSVPVSLIFWLLTIVVIILALRRSGDQFEDRRIPLMGIMAAFIFAGQMINFPVAGGTSGHLLGGTLAAIALGPWGAILAMTAVVGVQGLLFQDGGLLAMGANIFNMGILTVIIGYGIYRLFSARSRKTQLVASGVAAWFSVMAGASMTGFQLWLSGTVSLGIVMPAMLGVHTLIGIGEALITVAALSYVFRTRPDVMQHSGGRGWSLAGIVAALGMLVLAPLASAHPDGLERVAEDLGFLSAGRGVAFRVLPNYVIPALGNGGLSTIAAGLTGLVVVIGLLALVSRLVRRNALTKN
jgi:cobalt/nickel transport system permease protein